MLGALELQSRSIVAGSVRLVYAIFLSLLLGFSITIGTAIYGFLDHTASTTAYCASSMTPSAQFGFVLLFTVALMVVNQAKFAQMPVMVFIAMAGYTVNYFCSQYLPSSSSISSAGAALTISVLANVYSRTGSRVWRFVQRMGRHARPRVASSVLSGSWRDLSSTDLENHDLARHTDVSDQEDIELRERRAPGAGSTLTPPSPQDKPPSDSSGRYMAATAMLPAIFVLVPSGLSVAGSLVEGIQNAQQIANSSSSSPSGANNNPSTGNGVSATDVVSGRIPNTSVFAVGFSVVDVAIGLTVGLYMGALFVYPFGKAQSRSGLSAY